MTCHIDIETFSESPLKSSGMYKYAEHPSTEILVLCYAFDDGPVHIWVPLESLPKKVTRRVIEKLEPGSKFVVQPHPPEDLYYYVRQGGECRAHNSGFERALLNSHAGRKIGFPHTTIKQWVCTAAKVASHSLPRQLGHAAKALGSYPKCEFGKMAMLQLCKPRTGKIARYLPTNDGWEKFVTLYLYCVDDVHAERGIDEEIPDLSPRELQVFHLDQRINDRGVCIDQEAITDVQELIKCYKARLRANCLKWTGVTPGKTGKIADWVRDNGYDIENLQASTIREATKDTAAPSLVKRVLGLYNIYNMKAVSKFTAMQKAVCGDGRLHGMFMYYGANTGRWSSKIVQLQNLFRPVIKDPDVAIEAFAIRDLDWIKTLFSKNLMKVFASTVRGMLIAAPGKILVAMDFKSIEARVIAWLAGELALLEVFFGHGKVYEHAAAGIYKKAIELVTEAERFIGKIAILALGYQGGKKAFAKMAKTYGVEIEEERAEQIKKDWREANPMIVQLWYDLNELAIAAVQNPGQVFGLDNKKIMFKVEGRFLYMRLPSGRRLAYFMPEIKQDLRFNRPKLTYLGIDTYSRRWMRCDTYGGKLAENAVQAIARDLLVHGMFNIENAKYEIIGTVHDEVIIEVDENDEDALEKIRTLICNTPDWAEGLPVAAEGFRAKRYRK